MEVTTLNSTGASGLRGPTPLLRQQSDERLVTLTRKGNQAAYEALVARYQSRLLAFCRHMLSSKEDAEDVLQEVFAASYSALMADDRPINVRPWFYRIARNRSLNHLRKRTAVGVDSMDVHLADHGTTTADRVHQREEFRLLMGDVHELAETQRSALLLREIDNLSYDQIAEAMDTTVSSVKSLLVRARVSLAEASEARAMPCEEVRIELGEVAEGLGKLSPAARRHCRQCDRCGAFRDHLKATNKTLALMLPVAPFLLVKKLFLAHLGTTASAGTTATAVGAGAASAGATAGAGGLVSASVAAIASKTAAGLAAAAIVTAGAVEVDRAQQAPSKAPTPVAEALAPAPAAPQFVAQTPQPTVSEPVARPASPAADEDAGKKKAEETKTTTTETTATTPAPVTTTPAVTEPAATTPATTTPSTTPTTPTTTPTTTTPQTGSDTTVLPPTVVTDHAGGTVPTPAPVQPITSGAPAPVGDVPQPTTTTPTAPTAPAPTATTGTTPAPTPTPTP